MDKVNSTPEWYYRTSVYQINPRTFSKEGTFNAITKEIPFIASLGFGTIYLSCIAASDNSTDTQYWSERQKKSGTGNPKNNYRIRDHFKVDEEFGTENDLKALVSEAHKYGIRVLLDLVYLHIGPGADLIRSHPDYVFRDENGNVIRNKYNFPEFDYSKSAVKEYLWSNMVFLMINYDVDGFRVDVGDKIPLEFWAEGKRRLCSIRSDFVMINEGHDPEYLDKVFSATYCNSWAFTLYDILKKTKKVADLIEVWNTKHKSFGNGLIWRYLDNHDTVTNWSSRVETMAGHEGMDIASVVNYIIDGTPVVYCGNEIADEAKLSMFANRFYPGDYKFTDREKKDTDASRKRQELFKCLNELKAKSAVMANGETVWHPQDNPDIMCFERIYEDKHVMFIGNFGDADAVMPLPVNGKELLSNNAVDKENSLRLSKYGYKVIGY